MNTTKVNIAFFLFVLMSLAACKKSDWCEKPPGHGKACDLQQSFVSGYEDMPAMTSQFRKEYDPITGKASKVVVGLFTFSVNDSLHLQVVYQGNNVYLLREENTADTVVIAALDNAGRLVQIVQGNAPEDRLSGAQFTYSAGKLSKISFGPGYDLNVRYDAHGNVTELKDPTGQAQSFFYTYDTGVKAKNQFYSDDFYGDGYNTLFLAKFMGWLPDLEPVNKRITSRVVTGDYELYNSNLTDHAYDSDGNLVSYKIFNTITYYNAWHCDSKATNPKGSN